MCFSYSADTGSTVSTISLLHVILHIDCTDGLNLPYLGYTQTSVKLLGIEEVEQEVVLFVVPNTRFNKLVQLLTYLNFCKVMSADSRTELGLQEASERILGCHYENWPVL